MRATRWLWLAAAIGLTVPQACGETASDPESARCEAPSPAVDDVQAMGDHNEVVVQFTCAGTRLSGTAYLPLGSGPHPAVVWVSGDGRHMRLAFGSFVSRFVGAGVAFMSYDKRGVGQSEGVCCPGDYGHFNLLAADAVGAVNTTRSLPGIDPHRVGLLGASQAGWIVPLATARSRSVAFTALADAPAVSQGEELLYSLLTGEEGGGGGVLSKQAIAYRLKRAGPSGFDPRPSLAQMSVPGIWAYGGADKSIPTDDCAEVIRSLKANGKDFTVVVFPGAGHGLLDDQPSDPEAIPTLVQWVVQTERT
jgi:dienelactone hydrolase